MGSIVITRLATTMTTPTLGQRYSNRSNPDYRVRFRSIEINLVNTTDFTLEMMGDYFETGLWHDNPGHHSVKPQSKQSYIVTSKMGGFLTGVTGAIKFSVVGQGCFLYLCFSAPTVGSYKTRVAIKNEDLLAETECKYQQSEKFLADKYKDLIVSVEILKSENGCMIQYLYTLTKQASYMENEKCEDREKKVQKQEEDFDETLKVANNGPKLPDVVAEVHFKPPPPPPTIPLPSVVVPSPPPQSTQEIKKVNLDSREMLMSQIKAGVKLKAVNSFSSTAVEKKGLKDILNSAIEMRRSMIDSDIED